ncbi:Uncharacterised protein [Segatella copri]|nr:Uncharacterised protein [Segatella copri]
MWLVSSIMTWYMPMPRAGAGGVLQAVTTVMDSSAYTARMDGRAAGQ